MKRLALFLFLMSASAVHADTIPANYSNATSQFLLPPGYQIVSDVVAIRGQIDDYLVTFTFPDGYGTVFGATNDEEFENITFTNPVTSVSYSGSTGASEYELGTSLSGGIQHCPNVPNAPPGCVLSGSLNLNGANNASIMCFYGYCGFYSYQVSEPPTWEMLGIGLALLLWLGRVSLRGIVEDKARQAA